MLLRPFVSAAADEIALAALTRRAAEAKRCERCDAPADGEGASSGLFMWLRGDELQIEEPPLCGTCARATTMSAFVRFSQIEDEYDE